MGKKYSNNNGGWSLNKISFWAITIISLMYLVAGILRLVDANNLAAAANWIGAVATAVSMCIVAILAFRYVRHLPIVWMILYIIVLLILLVFIILPGALNVW